MDIDRIQGAAPAVDWKGVPAASFAHVLDRLIDHGPGPSSTATSAGIGTAPLLATPLAHRRTIALLATVPPVSRPRRRLSPAGCLALDALRRAGARLPDDFLSCELKTEFKRLARRLHPDMHPHASPEERQRLAARFADARSFYLVLQASGNCH